MDYKGRVLLIEDDEALKNVVREYLELEGYEIRWTVDIEGLLLAREGWPDVILLDVRLPYLQGTDYLNYYRSHPSTKKIPIVMMTGVDEVSKHGRTLRVFGVIQKPFTLDYLKMIVDEAIALDWRNNPEAISAYHEYTAYDEQQEGMSDADKPQL